MDGLIDGLMDGRIDGLMDWWIDWWIDGWIDGWMDGLMDWWMDWWIDWLMDWLIDGWMDWWMDWLIEADSGGPSVIIESVNVSSIKMWISLSMRHIDKSLWHRWISHSSACQPSVCHRSVIRRNSSDLLVISSRQNGRSVTALVYQANNPPSRSAIDILKRPSIFYNQI